MFRGEVILNEIMTGPSEHLLRRDPWDVPRLGTGPGWQENSYRSQGWKIGPGPFGFGQQGLGTDVGQAMVTATPSLYVRGRFYVDAATAAEEGALVLDIDYNDGFVAYLNGQEMARRFLGRPGTFVYADQPVFYRRTTSSNECLHLPAESARLNAGENILAIQVHNTWPVADLFPFDGTLYLSARLAREGLPAQDLIQPDDPWEYFVGHLEPSGGVFDPMLLEESPELAEFSDWVELHNNGDMPVNLAYWALTDNEEDPFRWVFPDVTIPAHGFLVVICSGLDRRDPGRGLLHTNFRLDRQGEYLGLVGFDGRTVSELARVYPPQDSIHSYGWDAGSGRYVYFDTPTPGQPNWGSTHGAMVEPPAFSPPAGFYEESGLAVRLHCPTVGSIIRYTSDGTEPSEWNGTIYQGPLWLGTNTALRVRAFRSGWIASPIRTATYLVGIPEGLASLPALSVTGDPGRAIYQPEGVTAIVGGRYTSGAGWEPLEAADYNMAMMYGRAFERPISLELLFPDARGSHQIDAGIRIAGSRWSRPRMTMENLEETVWNNGWANKPSFNFFFRDEYGGELKVPFFPDGSQRQFEHLRLRAGKNDWANPFIRDEVVRRLFLEMGHVTSQGILCNMFINGRYKGYFNLVERIRTPFYQEHFNSQNDWDVRHVDEMLEGDIQRWNQDFAFIRNESLADPEVYAEAAQRFDLTNVVDYLLLNIYCAMWDWPNNNFFLARERTETGQWRFAVWDAEGSFGIYTGRSPSYDMFPDLRAYYPYPTSPYQTIPVLFSSLKRNKEFRLLFADRIQKHLFGEGALAGPVLDRIYRDLKSELDPAVNLVRGETVLLGYLTSWIQERPSNMLAQCRAALLWPETLAPQFSVSGGSIEPGMELALTHPNGAGTLYFTLDGSDPRQSGGVASGTVYTNPVVMMGSATIKARVLNGVEWSPLAEARYELRVPDALRVTEIHYDPLPLATNAGSSLEFVEIKNVGDALVHLDGVSFVDGIQFAFAAGATLGPGAFAVIVANAEAFRSRYPGVTVSGVFSGKLDNDGEQLAMARRCCSAW